MFIAHYQNGKTITEDEMTWDEIPHGLINLQIVSKSEASPLTLTLGKYDAYYFDNEAVSVVLKNNVGGLKIGDGKGIKVAQVIAGIDNINNVVTEIRIDNRSNITVVHFPTKELKRRPESIRNSQ